MAIVPPYRKQGGKYEKAPFNRSDRACDSIIEELGISPTPAAIGTPLRRIGLKGTTESGERCSIQFLPDYCTFQIGSPLKVDEMYYLMDTDTSHIKIKFRRGEKFFLQAVTKETRDEWVWKVFTKSFEMQKLPAGYRISYSWKEGRILKDEIVKFSCMVKN